MKTIIAGMRDYHNYKDVVEAVHSSGFDITEVVSGACTGVDRLGEQFAKEHRVPLKQFPAHVTRGGRVQGGKRNTVMANYADALIAVWNGRSRGTGDMIKKARQRGLKIYVHPV